MVHYMQPHEPLIEPAPDGYRRQFPWGPRRGTDDGEPPEGDAFAAWFQAPEEHRTTDSTLRRLTNRLPGRWDSPDTDAVTDRLRRGEITHETALSAHRTALLTVLEEVTRLLRTVDADRVVITADHGEAYGEWGIYGHPYHMPLSVLRTVPFVTTEAVSDLAPTENDVEPVETGTREEKLRALGYRE
jgi:hypothetical protein